MPKPNGTIQVTVGTTRTKATVRCTRAGDGIRAVGDVGLTTVTLATAGSRVGLIVNVRFGAGGSATYQAIQWLRDNRGAAVGRFSAKKRGDSAGGNVTYLATVLDNSGKPGKGNGKGVAGSYSLTCKSVAPAP